METRRQLYDGCLPAGGELVPPGWLDLTPLLGTWRNLDPAATGPSTLVLRRDGQRLLVRALSGGPCGPADWGEVAATAYGAGSTATGTTAFSAVFDRGELTSMLAGYATSQGILVLDTLSSRRGSGGGAERFARDFFQR